MPSKQSIRSWTTLAAAFSFGLACMLPLLVIQPDLGVAEPVVAFFDADAVEDKEVYLIESIWSLFASSEWLLACVLLACALLLPILKFVLLYAEHTGCPPRIPSVIRLAISKLAMAEVFLIALFLVLIKEMPGNTSLALAPGFYCFLFASIAALLV
jgi:uncharacterized paraquat-inducible protein A